MLPVPVSSLCRKEAGLVSRENVVVVIGAKRASIVFWQPEKQSSPACGENLRGSNLVISTF